jgi:hypothetical protein
MLSNGWNVRQRKLVIHAENAPIYHSKMTHYFFEYIPLKKLPYPLYLRDVSPLDFYLFGKRNSALIRQEISDEIGLHEIVTQISEWHSGSRLAGRLSQLD